MPHAMCRLDRRVKSRCNAQRRAEESESGPANLLGGNVGVRAAKEFLESSKARLTGAAAGLLLAGMLVSGNFPQLRTALHSNVSISQEQFGLSKHESRLLTVPPPSAYSERSNLAQVGTCAGTSLQTMSPADCFECRAFSQLLQLDILCSNMCGDRRA